MASQCRAVGDAAMRNRSSERWPAGVVNVVFFTRGVMAVGAVVVVLLGAECTGKSSLAAALRDALAADGQDAVVVPEYLREFCDARGRTPLVGEQSAIADVQSARIAAAAQRHAIVIADTSALMTAVYSDLYFGDTSLYASALELHQRSDVTLLTGLDLPWQADGFQRCGPRWRLAVDARLRAVLGRSAAPYSVVCGAGPERVLAALAALRRL
jgi:nicotinamide riboside kinase